jgi:hypothetical protein
MFYVSGDYGSTVSNRRLTMMVKQIFSDEIDASTKY